MKAIEFETTIRHGLIHIPSRYKNMENTQAKVIVMVNESSEEENNYDRTLLLEMFGKANKIGLFNEIVDSVSWQIQQRDDWE
ncbi:MAG TPA: hypothetical protein VFC67_24760 [Prolixibacteraceae bacterium]|nr:hypothetical protein [Prolixibacteraceae bacterium]